MKSKMEKLLQSVTEPAVYQSSLSISPDSRHLAVVVRDKDAGAMRHVMVVPTTGGESRDVLSSTQLAWPVSVAWAPDGQSVLFVKQPNARDPKTELWLAPIQGGEPRKLELTAEGIRDLRIHPDGRHVAYTSGRDRSAVWVMENFLPPVK